MNTASTMFATPPGQASFTCLTRGYIPDTMHTDILVINARLVIAEILAIAKRPIGQHITIDDFIAFAHMHGLYLLIEALPKGEQDMVMSQFLSLLQPQPSVEGIFRPYYTEDAVLDAMRRGMQYQLNRLVTQDFTHLTPAQRERCLSLIAALRAD